MKSIILLLLSITIIFGCRSSYPPLASPFAPKPGMPISDFQVDTFLTNIPVSLRFRHHIVKDSLPNRSVYGSSAFLFRKDGTFINERFCHAHYPKMDKVVKEYDNSRYWFDKYSLTDELKSIEGISFEELPETDYYLIFYWSMNADNLMRSTISELEECRRNVSMTIVYVNINNREEYGFTKEEYNSFCINNRTLSPNPQSGKKIIVISSEERKRRNALFIEP